MSPLDSPLAACLALLAGWTVVGVAGLLRPTNVVFVGRVLFPLGALIGAVLAVVAVMGFDAPVERITLLIGLPEWFRELGNYRMLAFGLAMVLIMVYRPRGLVGHREPSIRLHPATAGGGG